MEKNGYKVIAVVALIMAVVALSVGFASFSATLSIQNAQATVQPDAVTLNVHYKTGTLSCTGTGTATANAGGLSGNPSVVWENVSASLKIGEAVTCTATIQNESAYEVFLKSITFPPSNTSKLVCSSSNANIQNMDNACHALSVTAKPAATWISTNAPEATVTDATTSNPTPATGISQVSIPAGSEKQVQLVITYSNATATAVADDTFTVSIPEIAFNFNTSDSNA